MKMKRYCKYLGKVMNLDKKIDINRVIYKTKELTKIMKTIQ
jgi:hypothetical protein